MYKQLGTTMAYSSNWMKVFEDIMADERGNTATFNRIVVPDAAAAIPVFEDGSVLMVENYRHGTGGLLLELPGGFLDIDELPDEAARRELLEETGYSCSILESKGWVYTWPGRSTQKTYVFSARGLRLERKESEKSIKGFEHISGHRLTRAQLLDELRSGSMIKSGSTISAIFLGYLISS